MLKFDHKPTDEELEEYQLPDKQIVMKHIIQSEWILEYEPR